MTKMQIFTHEGFLKSLLDLPRKKQQIVLTFIKKFSLDPQSPSIHYEKIKMNSSNLYSVRINDAYRGIVFRPEEGNTISLLYVAHHDKAYEWAQRRKPKINHKTGALEIVEIRNSLGVEEANTIVVGLFDSVSDRDLLRLGFAKEKLQDVRDIRKIDLLQSNPRFSSEEMEALELLAEGFSVQEIIDDQTAAQSNNIDTSNFEKALQKNDVGNKFVPLSDEAGIYKLINELVLQIPIESIVQKEELEKARGDILATMTSMDSGLKKELEHIKQGINKQMNQTQQALEDQIQELRKMLEELKESAAAVSSPGTDYLKFGKVFSIGDRIGGRYEVREILGNGKFCTIYRAQDVREGSSLCQYAVKVMTGADEENTHIVANEMRVRGALIHPNVGRFMFADQAASGDFVLILEYYEGESLLRRMEKMKRIFTWDELRPIIVQVLDGLSHIHNSGFVHGDVCPKNILIGSDGVVRLVEFGASGLINAQVNIKRDLRTDYQPPDMSFVGKGEVVPYGKQPSQDTFSLGVILCECLFGEHPYINRLPSFLELPRISKRKNIQIPTALEAIIWRACNADGASRYRNASEMKKALAAAKLIGI